MSYVEDSFSLTGKTAVVTGAGRGLGRAIAEALGRAGAKMLLVGRDGAHLAQAKDELAALNIDVEERACDLSRREAVDDLVEFIRAELGELHVLVNNAGITRSQPLLEYEDAAWDETLSVNLEAPFRLARGLAPLMPEGGSIINISSIAAELAGGNPAYGAAKGGLKQLTKVLAHGLAVHGIRVNAIGPGYFLTDLGGSSGKDPDRLAQLATKTMLGRLGEPEDLAGVAILLASDASAYVTGQDFYVDGGWLAKM
jgi:NAD(P)-dependent dehydrogenase (short-subunit alcohol dehydrogenase family)